ALEGGIVAVHDQRQGVDLLVVDQHVQPDQPGRLEPVEGVIQRGIAAAHRLQPVEEIQYHLVHRQVIGHLDLRAEEHHVTLYTAFFDTQSDDAAKVVLGHKYVGPHDGFAHLLDQRGIRQTRRVIYINDVAILLHHLEYH